MGKKVCEPNESRHVEMSLWGFRDERLKRLYEEGYWWEDSSVEDGLKVTGLANESELGGCR